MQWRPRIDARVLKEGNELKVVVTNYGGGAALGVIVFFEDQLFDTQGQVILTFPESPSGLPTLTPGTSKHRSLGVARDYFRRGYLLAQPEYPKEVRCRVEYRGAKVPLQVRPFRENTMLDFSLEAIFDHGAALKSLEADSPRGGIDDAEVEQAGHAAHTFVRDAMAMRDERYASVDFREDTMAYDALETLGWRPVNDIGFAPEDGDVCIVMQIATPLPLPVLAARRLGTTPAWVAVLEKVIRRKQRNGSFPLSPPEP